MSRRPFLLLLLLPAAVIAWASCPAPAPASPSAAVPATVIALQRQVRNLQADVALLDEAQLDIDATIGEVATAVAGPPPPPAPSPPEERWASVEAAIAAQAADPDWSAEAETAVRSVVDPGTWPGLREAAVECRTTLCRLDLSFEDGEALTGAIQHLPNAMPWQGSGMFIADDTKPDTLTWYMTREGYSLPG